MTFTHISNLRDGIAPPCKHKIYLDFWKHIVRIDVG